jgi:hypothetical protein
MILECNLSTRLWCHGCGTKTINALLHTTTKQLPNLISTRLLNYYYYRDLFVPETSDRLPIDEHSKSPDQASVNARCELCQFRAVILVMGLSVTGPSSKSHKTTYAVAVYLPI